MIPIGNVLNTLLKQTVEGKMHVIANWAAIMGPLAERISAERIEGDTIIVRVCNSVWMQELYALSDLLLEKINQALPTPYLKKIRFKHAFPLVQKKQAPVPTKISCAQPTLNSQERRTLQTIADIELRTALERFLVRCHQAHS